MFRKSATFLLVLIVSLALAVFALGAPLTAATTIPGGDVSGTWDASGSPYLIEGDITVPAGQILTIEPGVEVLFQDWYGLTVNGTLLAVGTEVEPILFGGGHPTAGWVSINIFDATDSTQLTYVIVENASHSGIYIENTSPLISYSTIRDNEGGGIHMLNSNASLVGNHIINNINSSSGGGVYMLDSNPELTGNVIDNNSVIRPPSGFIPSTGSGGGIFARSSDPVLRGNLISNNSISAVTTRGGGIHFYYADPILINNTITGNMAEEGAGIYLYYSEPTLINTILWNDASNGEIYVSEYGSSTDAINVAYTDIQGGQAGIVTNGNGTLNWLAGNIDTDPLFVDAANGDYQLQDGSPAVDAGTAYFEWNGQILVDLDPSEYNSTSPDMGAFESEHTGGGSNQAPVAVASADPENGNAPLTVQFSSDGSYDPDGAIFIYSWDFGDGGISNEPNPSHTYKNVGTYDAVLTVTDDQGANGSTIVTIDVVQVTQNELHVQAQSATRQQRSRHYYRGLDTILITDQNNQPVAGVTVTANYSGPNKGQVSGITGADGTVTLYTKWKRNPKETWCFEVTDVLKDGYSYNPNANVVTTQCE